MEFNQTLLFKEDLEKALCYYLEIDRDLASGFLDEIERMEKHLSSFPLASPLTKTPPIRKFLLKRYPYRIRYSFEENEIILLSLENMKQNKSL